MGAIYNHSHKWRVKLVLPPHTPTDWPTIIVAWYTRAQLALPDFFKLTNMGTFMSVKIIFYIYTANPIPV